MCLVTGDKCEEMFKTVCECMMSQEASDSVSLNVTVCCHALLMGDCSCHYAVKQLSIFTAQLLLDTLVNTQTTTQLNHYSIKLLRFDC